MTGIPSALKWIYSRLLMLYPLSFRKRFEEEMLLDFTEMAVDAKEQGFLSLLLFMLSEARDLPISLLRMHLAEDHMASSSGRKLARTTLRGALALGLAFAVMQTVYSVFSDFMNNQGWMFLLRIANSRGWHLDYSATAQTILYFSGLILGSIFAGVILALLFSQTHRSKEYVLATILCWVIPLALIRIAGTTLRIDLSTPAGAILSASSRIIIGLGFALLFSWTLNGGRRTAWLLLAGALAFSAASALAALLLPFIPENRTGFHSWSDFAWFAVLFGLEGAIVGAVLGAVSAAPGPKAASAMTT